ncbi:Mobile element protein [Methanosarcina barkeri str. Wiesmoor]|uniref:Mobile element protein n=3 Tax=Methanosarcina barkeri TaxID=2208 RepID=A0A0E3QNP5_METBA|nr:IS701 family transposase [Methanosarcina barkeri]AKB51467.1 Mobile element protein [Methanosarcina barkeri str. Wiesmoor]
MKQITDDFIKSNNISVEKYISEKHLESYFQTKTRCVVSTGIDYLNGLFLLPYRKNMRKMAIYCCKCSNNQSLSHFISTSPWRPADLLKSVRTYAIKTIGKNGVLILDESSIKKSGNSSVGVSHQYCGNLGKKNNCQVGVFLAYFKKQKRMLIDERLYLPQKWINDKARCLKAKIPPEKIKFRTKHELGLEMIDNAIEEGIPFSYVTMDGFYGENPELLTELENRGLTFVADVAVDTLVYIEEPLVGIPEKKGTRGRKPTISKVLNTLSTRIDSLSSSIDGWKLIKVRKTERGYKKVYFKAIKVWRRQNKLPCEKPLWLLISKDVESNDIKYSLCNASEDTSLDELAKMQSSRYWIERAFQDAKVYCGMSEYMVRSWNAWHHHMALVMLAMLILLSYKIKFMKFHKISLHGVILIMKFHNPLKILNAGELARILNHDNEMRDRARASRLKGS